MLFQYGKPFAARRVPARAREPGIHAKRRAEPYRVQNTGMPETDGVAEFERWLQQKSRG
jgi:hypothetical protein